MNKEFNCDIHTSYPVLLLDLLKESSKKLKCGKCISDQSQYINFLFIPDITNHNEDSFFKIWPPLSDENLRTKIIKLKSEDIDYREKITQFYKQFRDQIVDILDQKQKQQLREADKIYEFKNKIIEQYCKLADIQKLNECLNQENKQRIQIEEDLKQIIDSQFNKINEYTSILQNMMKQYELINKLNLNNSNKIQNDILKIVETLNVIPQNNFNFSQETDMFSIESIETYKKKLDRELQINTNNQLIQNNLMRFLNIFKKQLIFQNYPQNILNTCKFYNFITISNIERTEDQIKAQFCPFKSVYNIMIDSCFVQSAQCFINQTLKPNKKYEIIIQLNSTSTKYKYYLGLIQSQDTNKKYLDTIGLGFEIGYSNDQKQTNTLLFKISIQDKLLQYGDFCEKSIIYNANNSNNINIKGNYQFGIQFNISNDRDSIDIISFNELDEFS